MEPPDARRPPSVDALARSLAPSGLPHPLLVEVARAAIAAGTWEAADAAAAAMARSLLRPVVNATGVLLHTNLGRAPWPTHHDGSATNLELDLATGRRGDRHRAVGHLVATACGAEAALVVNNGAAAVLLALAALAEGRDAVVSRGELVEIGGGFRIPDVVARSGTRLVEVGTTNRTRADDYRRAVADGDVGALLVVHRSNFTMAGFTASPSVSELAGTGVPLVVDLGSGLLDAACPWLVGGPPAWLANEPGVRQVLAAGADLVTFSGDKLLGGPQAGIIAGRAELVARCVAHPLARALRSGSLVLGSLQELLLALLRRDGAAVPFWRQATATVDDLDRRARAVVAASGVGEVVATESTPGGGTLPGVVIESRGIALAGDRTAPLRASTTPVITRVHDGRTLVDLRTVEPHQDPAVVTALRSLTSPTTDRPTDRSGPP